jgi:hypothetical protein
MVPPTASRSVERRQTALRGPASSSADEKAVATKATPQKPLRADEAVTQFPWLDPKRVTAGAGERLRESRPSSGVAPVPGRIGASSFSTRSSGRIGRMASLGSATRVLSQVDLASSTGRRLGGQSKRDGVGRGPQRDQGGRASRDRRAKRGRPWRPSSAAQLPEPGRCWPIKVRSCLFSSPVVLVFAPVQPFRKRVRSNACCLRHR